MNQYEREVEQLERELNEGCISLAEYNNQLRDMQRARINEMRGIAEQATEIAYNDAMDRW